jgi:hypothetical protein
LRLEGSPVVEVAMTYLSYAHSAGWNSLFSCGLIKIPHRQTKGLAVEKVGLGS